MITPQQRSAYIRQCRDVLTKEFQKAGYYPSPVKAFSITVDSTTCALTRVTGYLDKQYPAAAVKTLPQEIQGGVPIEYQYTAPVKP